MSKQIQPKANDNNWLGIMGTTKAKLFNRKGELVGYCLDTPNAIAVAMREHRSVTMAKSVWGDLTLRSEYADRMKYATCESYFKKAAK